MSNIGSIRSFPIKLVWKTPYSPIRRAISNESYGVLTMLFNYVQKCDVKVNLSWHLRVVHGSGGVLSFQLYSHSVAELMKYYPVSGCVTVRSDILNVERSGQIQINTAFVREDGYCAQFIFFSSELQLPSLRNIEDEISVIYELNCTRNALDIANSLIESAECSLSSDLERIRIDEDFSDVTISVKGKNYPAHKLILAARSSVFKAMFKNNMQESLKNQIIVTDMEQETFEEMLHYIYAGKVGNLEESAFELLPAADKYGLKELKNACEGLLFTKISAENVGKILVLADMHNAEELKTHALQFIKKNPNNFETEIWNVLTESRPTLMKDILSMFLTK